ncbi:MAG: hypothetical protein SFX18_16275 [Pirellulales bacterium]|nr:hypothetical protein [Pirellulales bacterium]
MASVVTFWQLPDEEQRFFDYMESTGEVVAITTLRVYEQSEIAPIPIRQFVANNNSMQLYIGLKTLIVANGIDTFIIKGQTRYGLESMKSNVIGYDRPVFLEGKLAQSNLFYYNSYPDIAKNSMISKDRLFLNWAKKILNWMRRNTPEKVMYNGFPYRATKAVKDAVSQGKIDLCS